MGRHALFAVPRLLLFVVLQGAAFAATASLLMTDIADTRGDAGDSGLMLLLLIAIQGTAIALLIAGSSENRLRNAGLVFVAAFATGTVLTQIDTAIYVADADSSFLSGVVLLGLISSLSAAVIGVLVFRAGWIRPGVALAEPTTPSGWLVAATLIAILHVVVYFTVGYYTVWVHPEARAFYDGGELLGFAAHIRQTAATTPSLFAFQVLRGLIFAGVAFLIFRSLSLPRWGRAGVAGLFFLAFFAALLIVPNPFMPEMLRHWHLIETGLTCILMAIIAGVVIRPYGVPGLRSAGGG